MSDVRPVAWPAAAQPAQPASPARSAAQRAFFEQALGRAGAPAPQAAVQPSPAQPAAPARMRIPDAPPEKILRPGSLIDIKV